MTILWLLGTVFAVIYCICWYFMKYTVWCRSQTCLVGKTAIVTGANTGLGFETALDFAKRGARVILACRNAEKAEMAKKRIIQMTDNSNIVVKIIDMASFDSVRAFAKDINEREDRLDILVNNAGVGGLKDKKSKDGLVLTMQINYFSSFLLTNLLIGLLKKSAPSRVINVSSLLAKRAKFSIDDINKYTGLHNVYACSKLCNILFTLELAKRLKYTNVTTFSLHPGVVHTEIFRHVKGPYKFLFDYLKDTFFKTAEEGAQTTIFLSVTKDLEDFNGFHFDNCQVVDTYEPAKVPGLTQKVWEKTEEIVGLKPEEKMI